MVPTDRKELVVLLRHQTGACHEQSHTHSPRQRLQGTQQSGAGQPGAAQELSRCHGFLAGQTAFTVRGPGGVAGLRELGAQIRRYSLANLPRLLEQLEANLTANGVQVHWAQNADEANAIALQIAQRVNAKHIIKGKSMVSEEIGFNHAMEAAGIEAFESDMGEYIVQLAGEGRRTSSCRPFTRPSRKLPSCLPMKCRA
jgi:L-lactate dehydrogenase complex protein LldF